MLESAECWRWLTVSSAIHGLAGLSANVKGGCHIYGVAGDAFIGFCQHLAGAEHGVEGIILTLVTDDVDGWHQYLLQHNVPIAKPPTFNERFNIYQLFVRDPDGYLIEIQTFKDETWPKPKTH